MLHDRTVADRNTEIQNESTAAHVKKLTVVLPVSLWKAVKRTAAERETTAQQITHDALTAYLAEGEQAA